MRTESRLSRLQRLSRERQGNSRSDVMQDELVHFLQELHQTHVRDLKALESDVDMHASVKAMVGNRVSRMHVVGVDAEVYVDG